MYKQICKLITDIEYNTNSVLVLTIISVFDKILLGIERLYDAIGKEL